jgi:predicted nucleic acid-binding protein
MIYIDSSSLLKILWEEPESREVREAVARESLVVVSALTELETEVQLRAKWLGGAVTKTRYNAYRTGLAAFQGVTPFEFRSLPGSVFERALLQHLSARQHCRTLDRLHLAAMGEFGLNRLMTNDLKQAQVARQLGYEIVSPGTTVSRRP